MSTPIAFLNERDASANNLPPPCPISKIVFDYKSFNNPNVGASTYITNSHFPLIKVASTPPFELSNQLKKSEESLLDAVLISLLNPSR
jgi:hypothetical protein